MKRYLIIISLLFSHAVMAKSTDSILKLPLDYDLLRSALLSQLYTEPNHTARLWKDGKDCSFLDLSNPKIQGVKGQILIDNQVHARIGLKMGGKCIPALEWRGELKTTQKPLLAANGTQMSFPVTSIATFDQHGQSLKMPELEQIIQQAVSPKLADMRLDLQQNRPDIENSLQRFVDADRAKAVQQIINSLHFTQVTAGDTAVDVSLAFTLPKAEKLKIKSEPVFTAEELQQWQSLWLGLDMRLQESLQQPPLLENSDEVKGLLRDRMQEAGEAFSLGLSQQSSDLQSDPVHVYLKQSWETFSPVLKKAGAGMPKLEALSYLSLLAATDAVYALDAFAGSLGIELSSQGLRHVVRRYLAAQPATSELH